MKHTLLLFDIDGTILDAKGAGGKAWSRTAKAQFGNDYCMRKVKFAGNIDAVIYREAAEHNGIDDHEEKHRHFKHAYLEVLAEELMQHDVQMCPGIDVLIRRLHEHASGGDAIMLGLLTGNYGGGAALKLKRVGIDPDWFRVQAFGDEGQVRADLTARAMKMYTALTDEDAQPGRVIVIGDTPKDIECAKAHGCVSFAVATGPFDRDVLLEAGADVVVDDLQDPTPLLDLIDSVS
ncbi:HAD family hydrolase [Poriferisphaera sp. WC338]|uniref:HAD family hydrolase n=1 Tax=Poriferisphaera sp. WC338 TaxID=3425129 RepID=UPI003D817592